MPMVSSAFQRCHEAQRVSAGSTDRTREMPNFTNTIKSTAIAAITLTTIGFVSPVLADGWKIKTVEYDNNGAYDASFEVTFKRGNVKCKAFKAGGKPIDLSSDNTRFYEDNACEDGPQEGDEIWGKYNIEFGPSKSCRKDGAKFYYSADGGTLRYRSGGTTQNNNRCKISSKGGVALSN